MLQELSALGEGAAFLLFILELCTPTEQVFIEPLLSARHSLDWHTLMDTGEKFCGSSGQLFEGLKMVLQIGFSGSTY